MNLSANHSHLLIDAGNSAIKWACTQPGLSKAMLYVALRDAAQRAGIFLAQGTFAHTASTPNAYTANAALPTEPNWGDLPRPSGVWISNVAGEAVARRLNQWIQACWPGVTQHRVRAQARRCGVTNGYHEPQQLGSDRWASLIGAHSAYPVEALLIATLGTATTLEALDASGQFIGGLIASGATSALHALSQHTAALPAPHTFNTLKPVCAKAQAPLPPSFFALDTVSALQEGQWLAQAGFIERGWQSMCAHFNQALSASVHADIPPRLRCLLSGGSALEVAPRLTIPYTTHPHLVLQGLAVIALETEPASVC